jgi:hypothetical protein
MSELATIIGAIAPARRAEMSPMKPTAHTTVSKVIPINAKNAAFLRVMAEVYTDHVSCMLAALSGAAAL